MLNYVLDLLLMVPGAIIALGLREFVRAAMSHSRGDGQPKAHGRLTANPFKHLEPIGLILAIWFGFGWGKPVETSPLFYRNKRRDTIVVNVAPMVANLLAAVVFVLLCRLSYVFYNGGSTTAFSVVVSLFYYAAKINFATALFNVIPVYPLDGAKVLGVLLPPQRAISLTQYEKVFQVALILFMVLGLIGAIINPVTRTFLNLFL